MELITLLLIQKNMNNNNPTLFQRFSHFYDTYSQQIKQFYFSNPQTHKLDEPFVSMHSDYLNIQIRPDQSLCTKSTYYDNDIILQIRGSYVEQKDLRAHLEKTGKGKGCYDGCFGFLLWLDRKNKILMRPKGISQKLIRQSIIENNKKQTEKAKGNCYIEEHFGSKLLIKAKEIIPKGEKLIIEDVEKWIYNQ